MTDELATSKQHAETINSRIESEIVGRIHASTLEGLKTAMTINGAAAIAVLGYMGGVAAKTASAGTALVVPQLQISMLIFALGVLLAAVAYVPIRITESIYLEHFKARNRNKILETPWTEIAPMILMASSLVAFIIGCVYTACKL